MFDCQSELVLFSLSPLTLASLSVPLADFLGLSCCVLRMLESFLGSLRVGELSFGLSFHCSDFVHDVVQFRLEFAGQLSLSIDVDSFEVLDGAF